MKLCFFGTAPFAVPALRALSQSTHATSLVVTRPDRRAGRGKQLRAPAVKVEAEELGLDVFQPERVNTVAARERILASGATHGVVAAYGQILKPKLLALLPGGFWNVHASILPRHRGAAPINNQIIEGDEEVGVTIMKMDEGLDTGAIATIGRLPSIPRETAPELHDRLAPMGGDLVVRAMDLLEKDELSLSPQNESLSTYASMLQKSDGRLDFSETATVVDRTVRGLAGWPGAFAELARDGATDRIGIESCRPMDGEGGHGSSGEIIDISPEGLLVRCGEGCVLVTHLRPAGKRPMTVADFLNGREIRTGDCFLLPDAADA